MATVLITGGTGMVGQHLMELLVVKGYDVIIVSRGPSKMRPHAKVSHAQWNIDTQEIDAEALAKADHIIHLAGAGVADKRWTTERKQEIVDSRTKSSATLVTALAKLPNKVQTVVSASAIGWYGADTAESLINGFTEDAPADTEFLGETCRLWEKSIAPVIQLGKRLVKLRIGIVLSNTGGALVEFKKPLQFGIAGILGNGKQMISWIHVEDLCKLFVYAIEQPQMQGAYNAVASKPVTNKELTITLAKMLKKSLFIPLYIPAFVLKVMLGEMSIEVLKSTNVSNKKLLSTGFKYDFATIEAALENLK
ncbi:TIGR01777 family oxidoreductase [Parasediminibacterium paludis]|uniref:TIGR01777 family oxidoreductase n=1 Tax=Parasediminibacterium paludis TaxID=908966 RepID=A0ABV8PW52_9BACT